MLPLDQIEELVQAMIEDLRIPAEVVAATPGGHDSSYVEVLLSIADCTRPPCRLVVGLDRSRTRHEIRQVVEQRLREHPELHR